MDPFPMFPKGVIGAKVDIFDAARLFLAVPSFRIEQSSVDIILEIVHIFRHISTFLQCEGLAHVESAWIYVNQSAGRDGRECAVWLSRGG
jgi:hypothetical protein